MVGVYKVYPKVLPHYIEEFNISLKDSVYFECRMWMFLSVLRDRANMFLITTIYSVICDYLTLYIVYSVMCAIVFSIL